MFNILKTSNGFGGVWLQGGRFADSTLNTIGGKPGSLTGNDWILGMGGNDRIVDRGGADHVFGGRGSDKIEERVGGNLILGDETHPWHMGAVTGWGARGTGADVDTVSYTRNKTGLFVVGVTEWSALGKELAAEYGLDTPAMFDADEGQSSAYVVQNRVTGFLDRTTVSALDVDEVLDMGADILVGIEALIGTAQRDVFLLKGHDDVVSSGRGDDYIYTAAGNDRVTAGAGDDRIVTGVGRDTIYFKSTTDGDDTVWDFDLRTSKSDAEYDTLRVSFAGKSYVLSTEAQFADMIERLRTDSRSDTDAIVDGEDLVLDFGPSSIRFIDLADIA